MRRPSVLAIFGPTGIGKTATAIATANRLREDGEDPVAVSADALQVYRGLEILTGAADPSEQQQLEHRMVSFLDVDRTFSAGEYAERAHSEIDSLLDEGRRPIVVGGTGLYLRAALAELDMRPPPDPAIREHWRDRLHANGAGALHEELRRRAPEVAAGIMPTDSQRLVRTLELIDSGQTPPPPANSPSQLWTSETRHPTLLAGLVMDRDRLYARIDERIDAMVASGAGREVAAAAASASVTARKALGFDELAGGDVDAMKRRTRQFARRQLTWMRKLPGVLLIDVTDTSPAEAGELLSAAIREHDARQSKQREVPAVEDQGI